MVTIRPAKKDDLGAVSILAGKLVRLHHGFDSKRYLFIGNPEAGYARFLESLLSDENAVVLVAELEGKIVGYSFGRLEPRNWNDLLDACGKLHDIYVDESARGHGTGEALVREIVQALAKKGAPRVVLLTASQNEAAQKLFAKMGFRTTMYEMTRESDA